MTRVSSISVAGWVTSSLLACGRPDGTSQLVSVPTPASASASASAHGQTVARDDVAGPRMRVTIEPRGHVVSLEGAIKRMGCARVDAPVIAREASGELDYAALARCIGEMHASLDGHLLATPIVVAATSETPYQAIISTLDVLRDGSAGAFASFVFAPPPGVAAGLVPSTAPGITLGAPEEALVVIVSKTKLSVDEETLATFDLAETTRGLPRALKAADDLTITSLAEAARRYHERAVVIAAATRGPAPTSLIIADASTPYRALFEMMHTLDKSDCPPAHFLVSRK